MPITFLGWEVGKGIMTGGGMTNSTPVRNPCRRAFIDHQGPGKSRASWDPATTLFAIRGNAEKMYTLHASGTNSVNTTDGTNAWHGGVGTGVGPLQANKRAVASSNQAYLALAVDPDQIAAKIDAFLNKLPKSH